MKDDGESFSTQSSVGKKAAGLAIGLLAFFAAKFLFGFGSDWFARQSFTPQKVEQALKEDRQLYPAIQVFKSRYPDIYNNFLNEISNSAKNSASKREIEQISFNFMRNFIKSKSNSIAFSSSESLTKINTAQLELTNQLKSDDIILCSQFVMTGFKPGTILSESAKTKVANSTVAMLEAAFSGDANPTERNVTELSDADAVALIDAMKSAGTPDHIVTSLGVLGTASTADQCDAGVGMYRAVAALKGEQAARLSAFFVLQSLKAPD